MPLHHFLACSMLVPLEIAEIVGCDQIMSDVSEGSLFAMYETVRAWN